MAKLTKKQRKFLKTIENPKDRKYQKHQFKLQNKFDKFGLGEDIIFIDGIFKTDNPELIAFFNECPMVGKVEENSLTKESLRDLTEPKNDKPTRSFPSHVGAINKNGIISQEKLNFVPTGNFLIDSINLANQSSELINRIYKEKTIRKKLSETDNQPIPKEFCVEITEENKEVLERLWRDFHENRVGNLHIGYYLHSNSSFSHCLQASKNKVYYDDLEHTIVSTEEFLRYIGKEELIEKPVCEKTNKKNALVSEIIELTKLMLEGINKGSDFKPLLRQIEISTVKLLHINNPTMALEKIAKIPDVKPLEFDLPKKEYTIEDMEKCFNESRLTHPMAGFKYNHFWDYINPDK